MEKARRSVSGLMDRYGALARETEPDRQKLIELAVNESNSAVYVTDDRSNIIFVNKTFTKMLGYEPLEVYGRRAREVLGSKHYGDAEYTRIWADLGRGRDVREEVRTHDRNGREVWLSLTLRAVVGPDGGFKHLIGFLEDTTESRQIQKLQRDVLEAVAQEMPLREVMTLICGRVEAMFPEVVSSILAVDTENRLRPLAAPSMPAAFGEAIDGLPIGPMTGSCGTCAWRGEAVTVEDIETDPLWGPTRAYPCRSAC